MGWYGFDFDNTLATFSSGQYPEVGEPIVGMCDVLRAHLAAGDEVRIFTARAHGVKSEKDKRAVSLVIDFCIREFGRELPLTCMKDAGMIALYDDRAIAVSVKDGIHIASPNGYGMPAPAPAQPVRHLLQKALVRE